MAKMKTREKIMVAAEKLFSESGFDGVATKVIAKEAGVTEMTLFNHFKNKEFLYKTVVKERYLATEVESIFSELTYDDLEKDLLVISGKLIETFMGNRYILMMRLKEKQSFHADDTFKLSQDPLLKQLTPIFKLYEEKGLLNGTGERIVMVFMSSLKGLFYVCLLEDKSEEEIKRLVADYLTSLCRGISNEKGCSNG